MLVRDLVIFNRENYYNGAVQTEWFYDADKVEGISQSYVFHGPKYYGVSNKDVLAGDHKLIDTASFTERIADKLFKNEPDNNFVLTIAGYGTGKSHLAVTLGALFAGNKVLQKKVISNISGVDANIANSIEEKVEKKNLVIALNGMRNFNLDSEVLRCVRLALKMKEVDDSVLKSLTRTYDVAKHFINRNFDNFSNNLEGAAKRQGLTYSGEQLKKYLLENIESDGKAIDIVNDIFQDVTGDSLHWEQGISAGDILLKLSNELCGEGKPFNKVLILFDEFGRYIEYVAANPAIAGDASLQQIFEAVQSASGKAIFIGFIQYELEAYLSHIDKTANVIRYVGRYSASEKYYLSSNFETILANLLEKKEDGSFEKTVGNALIRYENFHSKMYHALKRWSGSRTQKNVWTSDELYRKVIMEGCYPLHPITVWILSNSSSWMQQRSTIAFCAEMFEAVCGESIDGTWLPYVYPVNIIDSGIYAEMLSSEEKGLVKSQNCMLYNEIVVKVGEKLKYEERQILKAVLISKIAGFSFYDKEDAFTAFCYCTNLKEDEIKPAVKNLEDQHGVIAYDEQAKTYDLIAEANGFNEFKRVFARYRTGIKTDVEEADEEILRELHISDPVDTAFAQNYHISSQEWKFEKRLDNSKSIDTAYINNALRDVNSANSGEDFRGILIYAYCCEDAKSEIVRLSNLFTITSLEDAPIIILFLDDIDGEIIQALTVKSTMLRFSLADNERFEKHISEQKRSQNKKIIQKFNELVMERKMITSSGITTYEGRLNALCTNCFSRVYKFPVPFVFDGFENSNLAQAKKMFATICIKMFDRTLTNIQSYQALNIKDKNRVQTCLSVGPKYSWQVFNDSCQLVLPQNEIVKKIYYDVDASIPDEGSFTVNRLFGKYLHAPYGMNIYSYSLFVFYFIQKHENKLVCFLGGEKLTASHLSNNILKDGKLKFSELQRVTIQKNLNSDVDVVAELCNEILENTNVYRCNQLRKKLTDTLRVEGEANQNQVLLGQAKMRLDDGDNIRVKLDERKSKISQFLDGALAKLVIHRFIGVFDYIEDSSGRIEEGLPYVYSQEYVDFMNDANIRIKNLMGETFEMALLSLRCSDITQLSSFQNTYTKVVKVLSENGFRLQANSTEKRVSEIVDETKARNQYNQALGECEKDVAIYGDVTKVGYTECDTITTKFEGWKKLFINADMPSAVSAPLVEKVNEILQKVRVRKQRILAEAAQAEDNVYKATNLEELLDARSTIEDILEENLPDEIEERLESISKKIDLLEVQIADLPKNIDELVGLISRIGDGDVFGKVLLASVVSLKQAFEDEQETWINRNIVPVEADEEFDAQRCTAWLERLRNIPGYISTETIKRAQSAEKVVTSKLHECKVQGVLTLYNSLSDEEKEEFKRLI